MSDSGIDVQYVADLARLKLSPEEVAQFQKQLTDVVGYISLLQNVDVSSVEAALATADFQNHLRADVEQPSFDAPTALKNAPANNGDLFIAPKMVE
jgi:aspartyl-tRNA(Asn)/glutamyl-tRNA(Gln) amidotransferase subunit C